MKRGWQTIGVLLMVCGLAGCATRAPAVSGHAAPFELRLTGTGQVLFEGKAVPPEQLVRRLKSAGATADAAIVIDVPGDIPYPRVTTLTSRLASAGYTKILFKGPRHANVTVQAEGTGLPHAGARP